jgi:hypothetical protein
MQQALHCDAPAIPVDVAHEVMARLAAQVLVMAEQPLVMSRVDDAERELDDELERLDLELADEELFADEE